eukprot:scaffold113525_cov46-Attheya_sp.AAC.2
MGIVEDSGGGGGGGGRDEEMDCPICLEELDPTDELHPLQCTSDRCHFNFCLSCIESLLTSANDDYVEASDGNRHVKVFLHCPNCRSDLGGTIRETLLLRKVDTILTLHPNHPTNATTTSPENRQDPDQRQLTPSQQRLKHVILEEKSVQLQTAIDEARTREAAFFGTNQITSIGEEDEECGVEADLEHGVHNSFRAPRVELPVHHYLKQHQDLDTTLLTGLESAMTMDEKVKITDFLTSGEPSKLAKAAKILYDVAQLSRSGVAPQRRLIKQSSVFKLIQDADQARSPPKKISKTLVNGHGHNGRVVSYNDRQKAHAEKVALNRQLHFLKMYPLPVRMPKYVELTVPTSPSDKALVFCNDTWDGTVMDAFTKITIKGREHRVKKKAPLQNPGVIHVLSSCMGPCTSFEVATDARIDVEQDRVLVAEIHSEGGGQGVMKGDVVTHLNGSEFHGTASDLVQAISELAPHEKTFTLVLNAEPSIAEALKRRSYITE